MKRKFFVIIFLVITATVFADPFTPGNIVVVRIGNGATTLSGAAQAVFLDEYTPCGQLVQSLALPVSVSGLNRRLTLPMYDVTEGYLTLSRNGRQLVLAGYDADTGTAAVSTSAGTSIKRTIAVVDMDGTINTSTALSDAFSGTVIRSAVADSNRLWMAGGNGGIRYATLGATSSLLITTTTGRYVGIVDSGLYMSSTSGSIRMAKVGSGLPVSSPQTVTALPGFPTTGSPYQFFMADLDPSTPGADVLYLAEDGAKALSKYSLVSGTWTLNGTVGLATDVYRGITGKVDGSHVVLYATRRNSNTTKGGSQIVTFRDTAGFNTNIAGQFELMATADSNTILRGIVLLPEAAPGARMAKTAATTPAFDLQLSPNPAAGQLRIRFSGNGPMTPTLLITNSAGKAVTTIPSCTAKSNQLYLNVKGWAKGVYYVTMADGLHKVTKKLLVQ